ncbi:capsular polysaccharide export protein, LipB/KpsS family, partial [Kaarinaea lacus]
ALEIQGVNAFNSLPRHREFYDALQFDETDQLPSTLVARQPETEKEVVQGIASLPERFIFVPFQVNTDSQITIHSPWIRNMAHLFNEVSAVQTLLKDKEISFVFKEHPSDSQDYRALHERVRQDEHLMFAHDFSTQELIEKSEAVITINSTVGFEALLLGKKVIVLGDAFYGFEGLTKTVNNETELVEVLDTISGWQPDTRLRENFLRYIRSDYAIPDSWTKPGDKHWQRMNEKFSCVKRDNTRSLFMVSTPLNLFMASAVALDIREKHKNSQDPVRCELCFIDQPGLSARMYIDAVKTWNESPFDAVHVFPSRASTLFKKLCNRRRAFRLTRNIIEDLQPDMIAVGNDRRIEFQYAMFYSQSVGYAPRGAYLDDGTFTYVGRKTKGIQDSWIDNITKKLFYGSWWQQPETVGSSAWIDDAYVAFPEWVYKPLEQKLLHSINAAWFESQEIQLLSKVLLQYFNVDDGLVRQLDVVITLPHASLVRDESGYASTMKQVVDDLTARGKKVGIKYHPRQVGEDPLQLATNPGVEQLPAVLAFEVLLSVLGNPVIVGDVSTTLLSSRWLRPSLRVIAITGGGQQEQFVDLFRKLNIEMVEDISQLAGKLQD